jgi:hypothetical protein
VLAGLEVQEDAAMTCFVTADRSFLIGNEAAGLTNADMSATVDEGDDDEYNTEDEEAAAT